MHGCDAGSEDVEAVDFLWCAFGDRPGEGVAENFVAQGVALAGGELLAVVEARVGVVGWQDDGCGIDGTGEATASGFVGSGFDEGVCVVWQEHFSVFLLWGTKLMITFVSAKRGADENAVSGACVYSYNV